MVAPWVDEVDELVRDLQDQLGSLPYDATPERLYTADDLYADLDAVGFAGCVDQRIYDRAHHAGGAPVRPVESLAQRLHDHGITVALDEFRADRRIVGVMGGHTINRASIRYRHVVQLGRALALAGFCVVTGGGPGAMEAANLGAATARLPLQRVDLVVDRLASAGSFADDVDRFIAVAVEAAREIDDPTVSLSIPTWFYGHEPSNPFATHIAKYFSNSEREDGLLAVATAGIVFVPGGPGTLQEVFQDAAQNAYETYGRSSPMVFLDPPDGKGGSLPWWYESGVLTTLDQAFNSSNGGRRPGADLIASTGAIEDVVAWLQRDRP
jgi:predicted Rossmann-fold nucleotide-binding protein